MNHLDRALTKDIILNSKRAKETAIFCFPLQTYIQVSFQNTFMLTTLTTLNRNINPMMPNFYRIFYTLIGYHALFIDSKSD